MTTNVPLSPADTAPEARRYRWLLVGIAIAIVVLTCIPTFFLQPTPHKLVMSVGNGSGIYRGFAVQYAAALAKKGITLELHSSSGAVENYQRLKDNSSIYDVALIQSGIGDAKEAPHLSLLASVSYEPLWLFYRGEKSIDKLSQLTGKQIGIGITGSGLHRLTLDLLAASGTTAANSTLVELTPQNAVDALDKGTIDAAFFIGGPETPMIKGLLHSDARPMNFSQADAIVHLFPSISKIIFPRGAIDLARDVPNEPVTLLSTTALLVIKDRVHPSLAYALGAGKPPGLVRPGSTERRDVDSIEG